MITIQIKINFKKTFEFTGISGISNFKLQFIFVAAYSLELLEHFATSLVMVMQRAMLNVIIN